VRVNVRFKNRYVVNFSLSAPTFCVMGDWPAFLDFQVIYLRINSQSVNLRTRQHADWKICGWLSLRKCGKFLSL